MFITEVLKKAWKVFWSYRSLWFFGVILALTTSSLGSVWTYSAIEDPQEGVLVDWELSAQDRIWIQENFGIEVPQNFRLTVEDFRIRLIRDNPDLTPAEFQSLLSLVGWILFVLFVVIAIVLVLRYMAETALIQMVGDHQQSGEQLSIRQGFLKGWSANALRLFLIGLVVYPVLITLTCMLFIPLFLPVALIGSGTPPAIAVGGLLSVAIGLGAIAAAMILWVGGLVTIQLARRICVLKNEGIFASIWQGYQIVRERWREAGSIWLVMLGIEMVYPIVIIPLVLILIAAGVLVGGLITLLVGALLALVISQVAAWTTAIIIGAVLFTITLAVPLVFLEGLTRTYQSTAWTLTYVELASSDKVTAPIISQAPLTQAGIV